MILALWTGGAYLVFVIESATRGAGLAWGLLAGGGFVVVFWLLVFAMLRLAERRRRDL